MHYHKHITIQNSFIQTVSFIKQKTPLELVQDFYEQQNNQAMDKEQTAFVSGLIEEIWEGNT